MDTVITAAALAAFTVAGFMFLLSKVIGWRGIARRKAAVDIGCTIAAFFLFAGTSTMGIFVAVMSGFIASVTTSIIGQFVVPADTTVLSPKARQARTQTNLDRIADVVQGWKVGAEESTRH